MLNFLKKFRLIGSSKDTVTKTLEKSHSRDSKGRPHSNPLGRLPIWTRGNGEMLKNNKKINRYLMIQETRIRDSLPNHPDKAVFIWMIMLKNSVGYQLVLLNRVKPRWYLEYDKAQWHSLVRAAINKCRMLDLELNIKRFYVEKHEDPELNGRRWDGIREAKLRPIGSPNLGSKVISKSLNDLVYYLFDHELMSFQHAYRKGRGVHTAILSVIAKYKKNRNAYLYSFDLKSFFNRIRPNWLYMVLLRKGTFLPELIQRVLKGVKYEFKELDKDDAELVQESKGVIVRNGVPQGLSLSPLIATLALELFNPPEGLFIYADDGIYIGDSEGVNEFWTWLKTIEKSGSIVSKEKSHWVDNRCKFLGTEMNFYKETITIAGKEISFFDKNLENLVRTIKSKYTKDNGLKKWNWNIKKGSYLDWYCIVEGIYWKILPIIWQSLIYNKPWKGYMFFWGFGIKDVIGSSSLANDIFAHHIKELNLSKKQPFPNRTFNSKKGLYGAMAMRKLNGKIPYIEFYSLN